MAYLLNGSGQWISAGSAPASGPPVSIAARIRKTGAGVTNGIFLRATFGGTNLLGFYFGSSNAVRGYFQNLNTIRDWAASGTYSTGTWAHVCVTAASDTSRAIYLNGGSGVTDNWPCAFAGIDRFDIGAVNGAATFDGDLAEVAVWGAELTASEVAALSAGVSPALIRPASLAFYAPLIRDLIDVRGGVALTNNAAAAVSPHPRAYR